MRTFAIGDIHGSYKALLQCLERSGFNKEEDTLIQLGDVADGYHEVYQCVEELLSIENTIFIRGNHDDWFREWIIKGNHPDRWIQGGEGTLRSYCETLVLEYTGNQAFGFRTSLSVADIPETHINFWKNQLPYYIDDKNRCFVHGGFDRTTKISKQLPHTLWWDRYLWNQAQSAESYDLERINDVNNFSTIFIGHTGDKRNPRKAAQVWNLDSNAGWGEKLTIMNVETEEFWQSDPVKELYPNEKGR